MLAIHQSLLNIQKNKSPPPNEECLLLGPLSLTIQGFMGLIILGTLLIKRSKEHPRRKMKVWMYDISKQILGSLSTHFLNVVVSILKGSDEDTWLDASSLLRRSSALRWTKDAGHGENDGDNNDDQCYWYFLNLFSDCTIGIPILWAILSLSDYILTKKLNIRNLDSGNYYDSRTKRGPLASAFFKQFLVFLNGIIWMKFCIFVILLYFENVMEFFADMILGWTSKIKHLEIVLVMFVIPILLNCFQYYCVDNIIKIHSHGNPSSSSFHEDNYYLNFEQPVDCEADQESLANNTSSYDSI
ncbi:hypothetical protein ACO0QE_002373 [Hanseniaspora vineae]